MTDEFTITFGEVDKAISILREVAQWRHDMGRTVWEPESITKENLMRGLKEENFCVGKINSDDVCSMILQWYNPVFWPQANEFEAGYIHKLCVREKYTGRKISRLMVDFAVDECRERGIHYLRLDTGWGNKRLCELYESLGFVKVDKYMLGDRAFALFEMRID
ncbi:MAG: hypothetical protein K0R31_1137 [Clostridiales bacterium]|nr:hypothetical protein [Clostridiales bacterium]